MGVRLVIGRAGTGKTALCVREIRAEMARAALGGALLWIVPEQGTFSSERLLLTAQGEGFGTPPRGSFRAQVLSFRRLAMLIVHQAGVLGSPGDPRAPAEERALVRPMDEVARRVLLEELVRRERGKLTVFGGVADRPGFASRLDATLRELRQHGHTGGSLRQLAERADFDAAGKRRLFDLAMLLEGWEQQVARAAGGAWDMERLMESAAEQAGLAALVKGAGPGEEVRIWVDATSAMSGLEMRLLMALAHHARQVTVTLLADPDSPGLVLPRKGEPWSKQQGEPEPAGLFARTERLGQQLMQRFLREGMAIEVRKLEQTHRFGRTVLGRVEAEVFAEAGDSAQAATAARDPSTKKAGRKPAERQPSPDLFTEAGECDAGTVEIWQCSDPETEVRAVAQRIRQWALGDGESAGRLRFREMAVIAADLEGYEDAVRRIFAEHGIPHFIDQKRSTAHHPLAEFLRSALAIVRSGWQREEVMVFIKTGLAGVTQEEAAVLENYLLAHGITDWQERWTWVAPNIDEDAAGGGGAWVPESAKRRLARVNEIRERLRGNLGGFMAACLPADAAGKADGEAGEDGAAYVRALAALLLEMGVHKQLGEWAQAAEKSGNLELAQMHGQIGREVARLLEMLEAALAGRKRTLLEFERLLSAALEGLSVGLIPPTVDQVVVSSVMRSRVPEMEAVFVIGAVEGQFPKVPPEDPILSDGQREIFNRCAAESIGEGCGRELLEMPFFDYVALTRARRMLVVSHPLADRRGKMLAPSRHLARIRAAAEDFRGKPLEERTIDAGMLESMEQACTGDDLMCALARGARGGQRAAQRADGNGDAELAELGGWAVRQGDAGIVQARRQILRALQPPPPVLDGELAAQFYPRNVPLAMSVSQLERYAACPLQYFLRYTLGLELRKEFQVDALSMGTLAHGALERAYREIMEKWPQWPEISAGDGQAIVRRGIEGAVRALHGEAARRMPGYEKTRDRLARLLTVHVEADRRRAEAGELRPAAVELAFEGHRPVERDGHGRLVHLPVLAWTTPGAMRLELKGKIDRVDHDPEHPKRVMVLDYKRSRQGDQFDLPGLLSGLALQLPAYALVLRELAGATPAAALYLRLEIRRETAKAGMTPPRPPEDAFYQRCNPRGVIDAHFAPALDHELDPGDEGDYRGQKSGWYKIAFRSKGGADLRSDLLDPVDFARLLDFTRWKLGALAEALAQGKIAPLPYRQGGKTPCEQCDFTSVCGFDQAAGKYRAAERLGRGECLAKIKETLEGDAGGQ